MICFETGASQEELAPQIFVHKYRLLPLLLSCLHSPIDTVVIAAFATC